MKLPSLLAWVPVALVGGCFSPSLDGIYQCDQQALCPAGLRCNSIDNRCYAPGSGPDGAAPGADSASVKDLPVSPERGGIDVSSLDVGSDRVAQPDLLTQADLATQPDVVMTQPDVVMQQPDVISEPDFSRVPDLTCMAVPCAGNCSCDSTCCNYACSGACAPACNNGSSCNVVCEAGSECNVSFQGTGAGLVSCSGTSACMINVDCPSGLVACGLLKYACNRPC